MNFFSEQDQARRSTKWLVGYFLFAVITLVFITNILVAVTVWGVDGQFTISSNTVDILVNDVTRSDAQYFTWVNFGKISLLVCSVISCAILYKWLQLRSGGKRIAEMLGGIRISPNTEDNELKQVINVVEEMALASGMPVPCVYLLKGEKGINAFAAGSTPADAVIGITQGALDHFNREQLQGVIAHEFSHILNGDMCLNLRMMTLLHGILFIGDLGEFLMRSGGYHGYHFTGKRIGNFRVFLLGGALWIVGWLGIFFGGLIKSAVSRQREFLADASAVQFTRNPQGIADALKIIGGYRAGSQVFSARTREASHMFISEALGSTTRFDTHPPLLQRIKRIQPDWDGQFIIREMKWVDPKPQPEIKPIVEASNDINQSQQTKSITDISAQTINDLPSILLEQAHDPFGACALVYALLLSDKKSIQTKQLEYIKLAGVLGLSVQTLDFAPDIGKMNKSCRLSLLELVMPALKNMSSAQYRSFKKVLLLVIRADSKYEIFEWCLFQLVRHYLSAEFESINIKRPIYKNISQVEMQYRIVLSVLAHQGDHDDDGKATVQRAYLRGAESVGINTNEIVSDEQCSIDNFVKATDVLARCYPLLKPRLLKGLVLCAGYDGSINAEEKEIISAVAAVMDCPMPSLLETLD